jgi:hypothetical protein
MVVSTSLKQALGRSRKLPLKAERRVYGPAIASEMNALLRTPSKKVVEVVAVLGAYVLFFAVGVYSGQTTMSVEIIDPLDGMQLHTSPVELVARVTIRGAPVTDAQARFTILSGSRGEFDVNAVTDSYGVTRLVLPVPSGNYTWHVSARKEGYPTIASSSSTFSMKLSLVVDGILPSTFILAVSPVNFVAKVTDMSSRPVESANVTFYVDSTVVGSNLTRANGIAKLSTPIDLGIHTWFASATKNGEGGLSAATMFVVGQLASLEIGDFGSVRLGIYQPGDLVASISFSDQESQTSIKHRSLCESFNRRFP